MSVDVQIILFQTDVELLEMTLEGDYAAFDSSSGWKAKPEYLECLIIALPIAYSEQVRSLKIRPKTICIRHFIRNCIVHSHCNIYIVLHFSIACICHAKRFSVLLAFPLSYQQDERNGFFEGDPKQIFKSWSGMPRYER